MTQLRLCLIDELVFYPENSPRGVTYKVEVPSRHKYFSVGYEEYLFISMLDGNTTSAQACGRAAQALGREALTQGQANEIVRWLITNGLAIPESAAGSPSPSALPKPKSESRGLLAKLNPFWMKIPLIRSDNALRAFTPLIGWMFDPRSVLLFVVLMIAGVISILSARERFAESSVTIFAGGAWVWTLLIWIVLKVIHELGHAAACRRYGGNTSEVGIVLVLLAPLAYVDVTSSLRLRSKWQRIFIAAAGMYVELSIAAIAAIVWSYSTTPMLSYVLVQVIVAASLSTLLFNANPLMKFDGYFMLADLMEMPNLQADASCSVRDCASRFLFARPYKRLKETGLRRWFILGYGFAALVWRFVVCLSLAIAAAFMLKGAGIALVGIGLFGWIVKPVIGFLKMMRSKFESDLPAAVRCLIVGSCSATILASLVFYLPISLSNVSPAIVQHDEEAVLRSAADGFIESIVVVDGQTVEAGEPLMTLRNDELRQQMMDLKTQLGQSEIRERVARQNQDVTKAQMERESYKAVRERLTQLEKQMSGLQVKAHRSGTIVARQLLQRIDTYVEEGDEILAIAGVEDRRIVASIAQQDIREAARWVGQPILIKTASQSRAVGMLSRIEPNAAKAILDPAMAGIYGGQLPVRERDSSEEEGSGNFELLQPRFRAIVEVNAEDVSQLPVGSRCRVFLGYQRLTIFQHLRIHIEHLLQQARDASESV